MNTNILLVFAFLPTLLFSQLKIPNQGFEVLNESPANGKKMGIVSLYFDDDNIPDTAAVLVNPNEVGLSILVIYLSKSKKQIEIPACEGIPDSPIYEIPLQAKGNVLTYGYYQDGTSAYGKFFKFRYNTERQQVQLIGFDVEYRNSPSERIKKSYNLLTGDFVVNRISFDHNEKEVEKRFTGKNRYFKNIFTKDINYCELVSKLDEVRSRYE